MRLDQANLLLITFDQWRGDWTDPEGPIVKMPYLEKLSEAGITARRCYTSSPQCVPARMSWLTGLAPSQIGVTRNCEAEIPQDAPSAFRDLQQAGWYTQLIGKTHWTSHLKPGDLREQRELIKKLGFDQVNEVAGPRALQIMECELTDEWKRACVFEKYQEDMKRRYQRGRTDDAWSVRPTVLPDHLYPDIWIANKGMQAIQNMPTNQPWVLWISFVGPHEPFDTPKGWSNTNRDKLPMFIQPTDWIKNLPIGCELRKTAESWNGHLNEESIEAFRKDYANNLLLLDHQLGRLTDELKKRTDVNKTAVTITSDHGEMLGDHLMLYKGTFLEGSIHVPFLYIPPAKAKNKRKIVINKPIELTNTFTLILKNLTNGGKPKELQQHCKRQNHVTVEFGEELLIIKNKRKLCCNSRGEPLWGVNLRQDPKEQVNVLEENKELLTQNKGWRVLYQLAKEEIKQRSQKKWMWRNIAKQ